MSSIARGRPRRYAEYDELLASIPPKSMDKRPLYKNGIGVFRGKRGDTAWLKLTLPHGGLYQGKHYQPNQSVEIKVGNLASFNWQQLEELLRHYQGRADRKEPLEDAIALTFSAYAAQWFEIQKPRLRSHKNTKATIDNHLIPFFGAMPLNVIRSVDINRWQSQQLKKSVKPGKVRIRSRSDKPTMNPSTVVRQLATLRSILQAAKSEGIIDLNPCANADKIRVAIAPPKNLDGNQIASLLEIAHDEAEWMPDYIEWALHSGMRRGEIRDLKWEHVIEPVEGQIAVRFQTGKTLRPRTVRCTPRMCEILENQQKRMVKGDGRIFPISQTTLVRKWDNIRKAANIHDVTIQDLRSVNATYALASGADARTMAFRLGHTSLAMLMQRYAGVMDSANIEAADKIGKTFADSLGKAKAKRKPPC